MLEVSTPGHPNYGMNMTRDEVMSYTTPSEAAISIPPVDNDLVSFRTTVRTANGLLDAAFAWHEYLKGGGPQLRTLSYSVPDEIAAHIDLVQPATRFGQLGARKSDIFETLRLVPHRRDTLCTEYARYADLQLFEERYVPTALGRNFSVELVNGGLDDQGSLGGSTEANLDVQYILGTSHLIPILEYSTGGRRPLIPTADRPTLHDTNEPYLEWPTYMTRVPDSALPQTTSVSYGEEEQSVPRDYALKIGDTYSAYFNRPGRGIPDVSVLASTFAVIDKGYRRLVAGTSASAPVVAGMVALLNAVRKTQGQPPLGFLNPWLYNNSAAVTDIVGGDGTGCRSRDEFLNGARWNATIGWGPVTGYAGPEQQDDGASPLADMPRDDGLHAVAIQLGLGDKAPDTPPRNFSGDVPTNIDEFDKANRGTLI
ncbi:Tripeptidyl-peptidase sed2 [Madurella mycetomatis]|uniref:Tripeptidyl-peptidase sed2 n=1 Tax=Madurella mycetomatis TaxID=100816 RepID=A0A175WK30_9PEZI|nr:Tripeptidyl-peptidase sed2 [Madurella mycetomatis]